MQKPVVNVMVKAARSAGNLILRHMSKLDSLSVFEKSKQDYASEVDSQAEAEIIRELRRAFPDYASLAADGRFARLAQDLFGPFSEWIAGDARAEIHAAEESFDETTSNG